MILSRLTLAAVLAFWGTTTALAGEEDRFHSPTAGFSIEKPESWVFVSLETTQQNRDRIRLKDAELEQQMKSNATPPLVVAMRHPEPYPDLNPSFQAGLRPLGDLYGKSASELLDMILPALAKGFADFKVAVPVHEVQVAGMPAARATIEYTLKVAEGGAFPTRSDMVVIPRRRFMFFIGFGRKPDDSRAAEEQERMLASIRIEP